MYETQTAILGCACKEFPPGTKPTAIMAAYQEARKRAEGKSPTQWGIFRQLLSKKQEEPTRRPFVPILLSVGEDSALEDFEWQLEGETLKEFRQRLLTQPVVFLTWLSERHENDDEWPSEEVLGPMTGARGIHDFLGISDYRGNTLPFVLAELPVERPWEVFACIPFGGWNECPSNEEQMAAAKYWHEKYGAVPAVITRDVLEYDLPAPVKREDAMALALEQYAFCPDIVEQGCGTVGYLADTLAKSTKWYFWWD